MAMKIEDIDFDAIEAASDEEKQRLAEMAIGRLFRMMMRPYREGDHRDYDAIKAVFEACAGPAPAADYQVNWARDRLKGAAGD